MTQQQFVNKLKKLFKELTGKTITDDETPGAHLQKNIFGVKAEDVYYGGFMSTLVMNGHTEEAKKKKLPKNWATTKTIREIAQHFIAMLILLASFIPAQSQVHITLGADRTDLGGTAAKIILTYAKSYVDVLSTQNVFVAGKRSFTSFYPELDFQYGNNDAFTKYNFKLTGLRLAGLKTVSDDDGLHPDLSRPLHAFPFSLGAESSGAFDNVNAMLYLGYVPFYQNGPRVNSFLGSTKVGVFLELGRKFGLDTVGILPGGAADESAEAPNSWIARVKGSFAIDSEKHITVRGMPIGISGEAHGWYDVANGRTYHSLVGAVKFYISETDYIVIDYRKGIGAPTFNDGSQVGAGLHLALW